MKLSVSLPDEDVEFLDEYSARADAQSRSSVIHRAIGLLRAASLQDSYAEAFAEWDAGADAGLWDGVTADGIGADGPGVDGVETPDGADAPR